MEEEDSIVTLLVPAAGVGLRMGGTPKQYRLLGGVPLLVHTLRRFEEARGVHHIVVAAPPEDVASLANTLRHHGIRKTRAIVEGRATRQASVAAALEAAPEQTTIVLVHDAVRPFVPQACIHDVIAAARREGAAALAIPVADTLRRGSGGTMGETLDREGLYRMQTPQAVRRDWFIEAHAAAHEEGYEGTDDVGLVKRIGRRVALVAGSPLNVKLTTPEDWALAEAVWTIRERNLAEDA